MKEDSIARMEKWVRERTLQRELKEFSVAETKNSVDVSNPTKGIERKFSIRPTHGNPRRTLQRELKVWVISWELGAHQVQRTLQRELKGRVR